MSGRLKDPVQPVQPQAVVRAAEIERRLADWRERLPAHSLSPGLMAELDALEDALASARREAAEEGFNAPRNGDSHKADGP